MTRIARTSRLAALGAAALLALTACGQSQDSEQSAAESAGASAEQTARSAETVDFSAGDCLTNKLGARDVGTFTAVDCSEEHNAEYLWSVPEYSEAEAEAAAAAEQACRDAARTIGEDLETTVTGGQLTNSADQSQHCLVYALGEGWTGQQVDPQTTLEDALASTDA